MRARSPPEEQISGMSAANRVLHPYFLHPIMQAVQQLFHTGYLPIQTKNIRQEADISPDISHFNDYF